MAERPQHHKAMINLLRNMLFGIRRSPKRPRGERSTSSACWRAIRFPEIMQVLKDRLQVEEIETIYTLSFFLATEKKLARSIRLIQEKRYQKLFKMIGTMPLDFDEKDYPTDDVVYIKGHHQQYIALIGDEEQGKPGSLKYFIEIPPIDLKSCTTRSLIYPV